jgi:hypothetical protein
VTLGVIVGGIVIAMFLAIFNQAQRRGVAGKVGGIIPGAGNLRKNDGAGAA